MSMSPDTALVIEYASAYLLAVLAPLIPAILIYKLFPDTKVSLSGPLSGLTLAAGGAFAAYVIVFLLSMSIMSHFRDTLDGLSTPVWTVKADVALVDENGKPVTDPEALNSVTIELNPNLNEQKFGRMRLTLPVLKSDWPSIHLGLGGRGTANLDYPFKDFEPQITGRTISLNKPVTIPVNVTPYNPSGSPQ